VFVLAIPHFEWKVVNLMIRKGYFKNLKKLIETGTRGSIWIKGRDVNTPVEFTSMVTGVGREKHGIGYGEKTDKEYVKDGKLITRLDIKSKTIWEIAQEYGKKVGLYNWVVTWPPTKVNGFMITDRLSQDDNVTYPPELKEELFELNRKFDVEKVTDFHHNRFHPKTAIYLIGKYNPELFLGMYEAAHGRDHMWWAYVEPKKAGIKDRKKIGKYREKLFSLYEVVDIFFKEVLEKYPDANILVVSESGMRVRDEIIYSTGGGFAEMFDELKLGIKLYAYDLYPPHLPKAKPKLYIPKSPLEKRKITSTLNKIKIKGINQRFFQYIKWEGNWLSFSFNFKPEMLKNPDDPYIELILPNGNVQRIYITIQTGAGTPDRGGVFIAKGPKIRENFEIKEKIYSVDIAPTILYLLNIPIPKYMEGRVLMEMIKK
jgi:predicted AlkP superfamily phosphohydrolase/phosphomutase